MSFGDLPAQHQSDTRPSGFRCKERYEKVCGVRQSWTFIADRNDRLLPVARPTDSDRSSGFERCIRGISDQVDQKLIELVGVTAISGEARQAGR